MDVIVNKLKQRLSSEEIVTDLELIELVRLKAKEAGVEGDIFIPEEKNILAIKIDENKIKDPRFEKYKEEVTEFWQVTNFFASLSNKGFQISPDFINQYQYRLDEFLEVKTLDNLLDHFSELNPETSSSIKGKDYSEFTNDIKSRLFMHLVYQKNWDIINAFGNTKATAYFRERALAQGYKDGNIHSHPGELGTYKDENGFLKKVSLEDMVGSEIGEFRMIASEDMVAILYIDKIVYDQYDGFFNKLEDSNEMSKALIDITTSPEIAQFELQQFESGNNIYYKSYDEQFIRGANKLKNKLGDDPNPDVTILFGLHGSNQNTLAYQHAIKKYLETGDLDRAIIAYIRVKKYLDTSGWRPATLGILKDI